MHTNPILVRSLTLSAIVLSLWWSRLDSGKETVAIDSRNEGVIIRCEGLYRKTLEYVEDGRRWEICRQQLKHHFHRCQLRARNLSSNHRIGVVVSCGLVNVGTAINEGM